MEDKWPWALAAVAAVVGAVWWYNTQSGFVSWNDGTYDCRVVTVGSDGKYQVVTLGGEDLGGYLEVEDGEMASMSAPQEALGWSDTPDLSYDNKGRDHVKVTDLATYSRTGFAFACDHRG